MPIRLIIETATPGEIAPMPQSPSSDYIEAALRTARHSKSNTRTKVLKDVCDVLSCRLEDLYFLFESEYASPKTCHIIDLNVPDYGMDVSEVYKAAAE